ncbi:MAG: alpha-ketoglutarate-dependent dioxygenase AlkB [Alphaproteobacteria bacterium]
MLFDLQKPEIPKIEGLRYCSNFISGKEQDVLLAQIDSQPWLNDLKRRVQHYGYKYDYKARNVVASSYLGELPIWLAPLQNGLLSQGIFKDYPNQAIVNEYLPGQGISAHIDCVPCFGDVIASLSLGSDCMMQLSRGDVRRDVFLEKCSLIILSGDARYVWQHGIPARKSDVVGGLKLERQRRVSVTFRTVTVP